jgi:CheY-like chemotaxis protein
MNTAFENAEILVLDAEADDRARIESILAAAGMRVRVAASSDEGLAAAQARPPQLVLIAISLPDRDGFDTSAQLRQHPATGGVPVIFIGELADSAQITRGYQVGGADFVTRPIQAEVLLARVTTHLALSQLQTTLRREHEERRRAEQIADAANQAKSDFLANMSHEIRTPMTAILGMSHLALRSGLSPKQQDYIRKVERSAEVLLGILNDILDFSKIEAGKLTLEHVPFQLGDIMANLANVVGLGAEEKGLELLFVQPASLPLALVGDPVRLGQILVNLGSNAVKFTEHGEITVSIEVIERGSDRVTLRFSVRDTGDGISPAQRSRLFQPFSQGDASLSRRYGGTGLGLAISHHLVGLMGGEIDVESEPGRGSTFFFTVRLGLQAAPVTDRQRFDDAPRVLIVDDNASARRILMDMTEGFGLVAEEARDGWDALRAVSQAHDAGRPYDLVLLDWKMPGMDGVECARHLTLEYARPPTVLMITAFGRDEAMRRLLAQQVTVRAVLAKPVTPSSLHDAVAAALEKSPRTDSRQVQREESLLAHQARLRGARILLVEDNAINQELALELLSSAGLAVTVADNGQRALEILAGQTFDGILMDCQMPVLDGYEATRILRRDPRWKRLPVIAMTANAMTGDRDKVLAAGMNDHIAKPINVELMFAIMARWIAPLTLSSRPDPATAGAEDDPLMGLPGIDARVGRASTMGNDKLYRRLLGMFHDGQRDFETQFQAARDAGDGATAMRLAHNLRAVGASLGALGVQRAADGLERACADEEDTASINRHLRAVLAELAPVIAGLADLKG